jgi:mono/diheme cytochrome c family protein
LRYHVVMKRLFIFSVPAIGLATMSLTLSGQATDPKLERGKYIVEEVARCQECHTPKRGGKAGPPMPAYRMKAEDAEAVAASLKSLP